MLASARACSNKCRAVTRMSRASFSRWVEEEGMCKDYRSGEWSGVSRTHGFPDPLLDDLPQFPQSSLEEVVGAGNQNQLLRVRKRHHQPLQLCRRAELVAIAADEQLGLATRANETEVIGAIVNRRNRQAESDHGFDPGIRARGPQSHPRTKGKSGEDQRKVEFAIQPVQCRERVMLFTAAVVVLALAQAGTAKIEP